MMDVGLAFLDGGGGGGGGRGGGDNVGGGGGIGEDDGKESAPDEYVVEAIIDKKSFNGADFYLVKWLGWPLEESTWEPKENCVKCDNLIKEYEAKVKKQKDIDSSVRRAKSDESSSSSEPEIISDYEYKKGSRGRKKKTQKKRSFARSKREIVTIDDDDDSDYDKVKRPKRRKIKKGNQESDYLSTHHLNGESRISLDLESCSSKSKRLKEDNTIVKKSREIRESEAINQYRECNGVGGSRSRSKEIVSEDTRSKKIVSSQCAREIESKPLTVPTYGIKGDEVVQQRPVKELSSIQASYDHVIHQQQPQSTNQTVIEKIHDNVPEIQAESDDRNPTLQQKKLDSQLSEIVYDDESEDQMESSDAFLKRKRRISSTESETDTYDGRYFGWERGKKIVQIIDWYGYEDKVLHHVKYEDGEHEYVDDSYTCINYPVMVFELYEKSMNDENIDENVRMWIIHAGQRLQNFLKSGACNEEGGLQNGFAEDSTILETTTEQAETKPEGESSSDRSETCSSEESQIQSH